MKFMYKLMGILFLLIVLVPTGLAGMTEKLVSMPVMTEPKYFSEAGELHLNETALYFTPGGEPGVPQMFGTENRSVVGLVVSLPVEREEVTYSRINGKTVMNGGRSMAAVDFAKVSHKGMDEVLVTNESLSIYVAKESCESYSISNDAYGAYIPDLQLSDGDTPLPGFVITWVSNPDTINYAFILPQYVDFVLDQFVVCPPLTSHFQG